MYHSKLGFITTLPKHKLFLESKEMKGIQQGMNNTLVRKLVQKLKQIEKWFRFYYIKYLGELEGNGWCAHQIVLVQFFFK
jgi:hypothetical protein